MIICCVNKSGRDEGAIASFVESCATGGRTEADGINAISYADANSAETANFDLR